MNATVGAIDANVAKIRSAIDRCVENGVELVVFPELAITGYPPEDLLLRPGFIRANLDALGELAQSVDEICAVVGYVDMGDDLYNAAAVLSKGEVLSTYHKRALPNYSVFDEVRYFRAGTSDLEILCLNGINVGVSICEDAWSPDGPILQYGSLGADLVININASPFSLGKQLKRERMLSVRAADASVALVYVNLVGGQDELVFDGGSVVFSAQGEIISRMDRFVEGIGITDIVIPDRFHKRLVDPRGRQSPTSTEDSPPKSPATVNLRVSARRSASEVGSEISLGKLDPLIRPSTLTGSETDGPQRVTESAVPLGPYEDPSEVYKALVLGTRDYVEKNGFPGVLLGLSGGVDSALVATIAVDAVGADRVCCVSMPSRYSSSHSVTDAEALCRNLDLGLRSVPIERAHATYLEMLGAEFHRIEPLVDENLQSRLRGIILMAISNQTGSVVLTTGNKSEQATGYSTLYGDTAGGFAVIKDVSKLGVYQLCSWRNSVFGFDAIPDAILEKPPSAELRPDQRDDQSLPSYDVLDALIELYVEDDMTPEEIKQLGHRAELVDKVARLIDRSEYKRRQNPPGVRITEKAFGKDRRMPITNGFLK